MAQDPQWDDIFTSQPGGHETGDQTQPIQEQGSSPISRRSLRNEEKNTGRPRRTRDNPRRPGKRKGKRWLVWTSILLAVLAAGAGSAGWAWANYEDQIRKVMGWEEPIDYVGNGHGEVTVVINSGDGGDAIATKLAEAGVTKTWDAFYKLLLVQDPQVQFFPGQYLLKEEMSAKAALAALQDPANKVEISVLIHEGKSISQVMAVLSEGTGIPLADFDAAAADPASYGLPAEALSLEGYLFPARYTFQPGSDAATVLQTLVNRTFQSLDTAGVAPEDRHRVLTIASMIQREAGSNPDNFYKVSRVIQNRLATNMKLEFDSTAHYGYTWAHGEREKGSVFSSTAELNDSNPYNTYVHTGLPPGPIGASGDLAIDAAMNPVAGSWIFFATVNLDTGETTFSTTLAEHNAAVSELRRWCRDTKSPNCD